MRIGTSTPIMSTYKNVRVAVEDGVATIVIDRPAVKNALNLETVEECRTRARRARRRR